jgi:hypothetical protein
MRWFVSFVNHRIQFFFTLLASTYQGLPRVLRADQQTFSEIQHQQGC